MCNSGSFATFEAFRVKIYPMGEVLCIEVCCKITWRPSLLPHWSLVELLISLRPEIYWSLDEVILEQYLRVLYSGFKVVSNNYYFSNMFSP
jgi:hypothetical protein